IGNLWIGTDGGGFVKYNAQTGSKTVFNSTIYKNKIPNDRIWSILNDKDGIIWAGTYSGGLIRLIQEKQNSYRFNIFKYNPGLNNSLTGKQVNVIYEDREDRIWIGTKRGLDLLISSKYDSVLKFHLFTHDVNNPHSISDNYVSCILQDSYGYLWVGTYISGLNQLDIETGNFTHYNYSPNDSTSISNNRIQAIFEDSFNNLWIGTEGAGLNKFDRKRQSFIRIKQNNELFSNVIMAILEDNDSNLWISTSGGINKFDLRTETFVKKYDITDGIISNGFNRNACYKDKNNTFYFGSILGVTYFNPTDIKDNPYPPPVLISDFKIFNTSLKKLDPLRERILKKQKRVDLDYSENVFNIEVAAADYSAVYKNKFKYKLDGFEKQWINLGNQHKVTYTNLYPGKYTFRVIASNNDDVWNNVGNSILIVIHPPFFLKKGFIISVILSLLALIYIGVKLKIKKYDRDKRILETKVEERTREINKQKEALKKANIEITENARLKEMFLANTSHEIRTPLNVIVGFTNLLTNTTLNKKQQSYLKNIKNYSRSLLVLINDILDFSKIEAGKLSLEKIKFEFRTTIKTILTPLIDKAKTENLALEYHIGENIPTHFVGDPVRLNQILNNLIENSIKFTHSGGNIKLEIAVLKQEKNTFTIQFKVSDTGIGINPNKFDKIFESFSQARSDTSRKYGGTGLGLTIVKRLVELHNGNIAVESELEKGSVFTFSLKYKQSQILEKNQEISTIQSNETTLTKELRILLVEDNIANQTLAVDTILMFNNKINIDVADNGVIAIQKINDTHYDLIIMDVQMPEMNGYDTTNYIRTKYNNYKKNIPILGMSAHAMNKEKEKCLALGMNDYITKPFNPNVLFSKILILTGQKQENTQEETSFVPETLIIKNKYDNINLEFLTKTYNGNFDKVKNILKIYLQNIPEQITEFNNNFNEKNWSKIKTYAHTLKTSFKYLGVDELHKLFKNIELESSSGSLSATTGEKINTINDLWKSSKQEIQNFLNSTP
ncbi:MAG: response regulator, partial [Chlorobi bacterium]|nr:response regulator [Chlorobiota bacterium]